MQNPAEQVKKQHTKYKEEEVEYTYRLHHSNKNTRGASPRVSRLVQICLLQLATAHDVRGSDGG